MRKRRSRSPGRSGTTFSPIWDRTCELLWDPLGVRSNGWSEKSFQLAKDIERSQARNEELLEQNQKWQTKMYYLQVQLRAIQLLAEHPELNRANSKKPWLLVDGGRWNCSTSHGSAISASQRPCAIWTLDGLDISFYTYYRHCPWGRCPLFHLSLGPGS